MRCALKSGGCRVHTWGRTLVPTGLLPWKESGSGGTEIPESARFRCVSWVALATAQRVCSHFARCSADNRSTSPDESQSVFLPLAGERDNVKGYSLDVPRSILSCCFSTVVSSDIFFLPPIFSLHTTHPIERILNCWSPSMIFFVLILFSPRSLVNLPLDRLYDLTEFSEPGTCWLATVSYRYLGPPLPLCFEKKEINIYLIVYLSTSVQIT